LLVIYKVNFENMFQGTKLLRLLISLALILAKTNGFTLIALLRPTIRTRTSCLFASSSDIDDDFMASLKTRVNEVVESDKKLPLVVLDSMLPRQVLRITINNGLFLELVRTRIQSEQPYFGMMGKARLNTGQQVHLKSGVEVHIVGKPLIDKDGLHLQLKAGRRFRIEGNVENAKQGWTEATINFLDSAKEESDQIENPENDPFSIARAMQQAKEFSDHKTAMNESKSLVDTWLDLARTREHQPGQIDQLLQDIGPLPSWQDPSECAFWVGALINPIPALGVAFEIRPSLLTAQTAEQRTQIALTGLWNSIQHMQGADNSEQRK
jgi:hypothetical protein